MDPVLNQTTTTRTTSQVPNTRDYNTWSDRELRKELKRYGEKLPKETERSQLLSRLQFFETNQTSGVSTPLKTSGLTGTTGLPLQSQSISNYPVQQTHSTVPLTQQISNQIHSTIPSQTQHSTIPISQPITGQTHSTFPVQQTNRDFNTWSDRELRKELKKFGEKVPRETERSQLLSRLQFFETNQRSGVLNPSTTGFTGTTGLPLQSQSISNYPVQQTQSTIPKVLNQQLPIQQTNRDFNTWTEKEMRTELKKFGERAPKDTQRAELIRRLAVHEKPVQTTTTQGTSLNPITSLVQGSTKDHKDASDRDLRKELKKHGERVPKETERAELLRRLAVHEKSSSITSTHPTSQTIKTPTHTTTPVHNTNRDFNSWTEKEMRKELKKHGEKVSKDTDRAELIRRLNVHEKPVSSSTHHGKTHPESSKATIVTEDSKYYKDFSDRNLRKELKKKHGEKVPRHTDRAELIRRLAAYENPVPKETLTSSHVKSTAPVTGSTHLPSQTHSVTPVQQSTVPTQTIPLQQTGYPQQYQQTGFPQQQTGFPSQYQQSGFPQQTQQIIPQQYQQNIPQQSQFSSGSIPQNTSTPISNQQSIPQTQHSETSHHNTKHN